MPARISSTFFSPKPGSSSSAPGSKVYRSWTSFTSPCRIRISRVSGPTPSMSIWSRAAKKRRRPRTWSGQSGLGQKWCAPCATRPVRQEGQASGICPGAVAQLVLLDHPLHRRDHVPPLGDAHPVADGQLQQVDVVLVVQGGVGDRGAGELHRPDAGHRGDPAGAPDLHLDALHGRFGLGGLELEGQGPARVMPGEAQGLAGRKLVHLDHQPVDVVGQAGRAPGGTAPGSPPAPRSPRSATGGAVRAGRPGPPARRKGPCAGCT